MSVFVGRVREIGSLEALLDEARRGRGALALLSGEPGIGKSRLAEEVSRAAEERGWTSAWGRSWEGAGTPAFWPWTQALRRLASIAELREPFGDEGLRPVLAPESAPVEASDAEEARFHLFDAVARALAHASTIRPLLVVLDDLHAADSASLALLQFVARGLRGSAIVILGTSREAFFAGSAETPALLARIAREAQSFPLARLAKGELGRWVADAAPSLPVERVFAASEGNPLFVEELIAAERKRPGAAWTGSQMPLGIREAVRAHLVLLPESAQVLLETASVLGRETTRRALAAIATKVEMDALGEALTSGVLEDVGEGRLRFSHVLQRDELYARLSDERRRALHEEAARTCEESALAAHHAICAATQADAKAAFARVERAMREASGRLAHADAAALGRRALESLGPDLDAVDACALEVAIAEALVTAGDLPEGQAMGARAARHAEALGLGELLARAALACTAEIGFASDPAAMQWLRSALALLLPEDSSLRAVTMARLSIMLHNSPADSKEMRSLRDEAIAMARRTSDEKTLLGALYGASAAFPFELAPAERHALYGETVALAERLGTTARLAPLLAWHVVSFLDVGDPAGAEAAVDRMEMLLSPYPQPHHRWRAPLVRAVLAALAGRFGEAERLASESLVVSREAGGREPLMMNAVFRTVLPYVRGDEGGIREARPLIEEAMAGAPQWDVFGALADAPLGRIDRVRASFARLRELPVRDVVGAAQLGWACVRAGLVEDARLFYDLRETGPALTRPLSWAPGGFGCNGPASLLAGHLAAMTGREDEAREAFREAAAVARAIASPPFIAQAELASAELLAPDDPIHAREHAGIALEEAESVGLGALADRARAVLGGAPRRATDRPTVLVVAREGELWSLRAGGRRILLGDAKGLGYLEALVQEPHRAMHVLELAGIDVAGDAGPVLDQKAKEAYRARAEDLRAELEEATANGDLGRIERARRELDLLGGELARAFGLGGRDRRAASAAERARINVQRRLKDVIRRVAEQDAALGRHLDFSVKTGLFCVYAPTWPAD